MTILYHQKYLTAFVWQGQNVSKEYNQLQVRPALLGQKFALRWKYFDKLGHSLALKQLIMYLVRLYHYSVKPLDQYNIL